MNRYELFRTLRKHIKLSEKRSLAYEQNKTAKAIMYVMACFAVIYMIFIAIMFALIANSSRSFTPYEFIYGLLPFILVIDFLLRFISQRTPAQLVKPYMLLPISKYACVESFIISSMISTNNLLWLFITIPYVIMTMIFSYGFMASLGFVIAFQLIDIINSQNYMLWRTMINRSVLWWIAPIIIYGGMFLPWLLYGFDEMFDLYSTVGSGATSWNPLTYIIILLVLAMFFFINRNVQYHITYDETANAKEHNIKHVSEMKQLDRFGEIGEYLKLEIKSIMRNKNVRKSFVMSILVVILFSCLISYTDAYSDQFSRKFWIVYTFVLYGAVSLIKIMSSEGNYIDGLMVHRENIYQLLRAKYYFYSALLFVPFFLMLPTVFAGKYSILMMLSMLLFTAGPVFCLLMQMAVYNRQTIPLNEKFISKGNVETNWFQVVAELIAMFAPVAIISLLMFFFSENMAYTILMIIGIVFIATHKLWIYNIYRRLMARRYQNMESFRATR